MANLNDFQNQKLLVSARLSELNEKLQGRVYDSENHYALNVEIQKWKVALIAVVIGLSLMFNVRLPINFNSPYKAINIIEFWRRWHMTLSRFLRDYLYIPLGGSRNGKAHRYLNLMVTMLLGGLWHGAGCRKYSEGRVRRKIKLNFTISFREKLRVFDISIFHQHLNYLNEEWKKKFATPLCRWT